MPFKPISLLDSIGTTPGTNDIAAPLSVVPALGALPFLGDEGEALFDPLTPYICLSVELRPRGYLGYGSGSFGAVSGDFVLALRKDGATIAQWNGHFSGDFHKATSGIFVGSIAYDAQIGEAVPAEMNPEMLASSAPHGATNGGTLFGGGNFGVSAFRAGNEQGDFIHLCSPWYRFAVPPGCAIVFSMSNVSTEGEAAGYPLPVRAQLKVFAALKPVVDLAGVPGAQFSIVASSVLPNVPNPHYALGFTPLNPAGASGFYWQDGQGNWTKEVFGATLRRRIRTNRLGKQMLYSWARDSDGIIGYQKFEMTTRALYLAAAFDGLATGIAVGGTAPKVVKRIARRQNPLLTATSPAKQAWQPAQTGAEMSALCNITQIGLAPNGGAYFVRQSAAPSDAPDAARLRGAWQLVLLTKTRLEAADWTAQGATMWNDPNVIWADVLPLFDGSGLSLALFLTSSDDAAVQTLAFKSKRAESCFKAGDWPADADAKPVTLPGLTSLNPAALTFRLVRRGGEIFLFWPLGQSYRSTDGGFLWEAWG